MDLLGTESYGHKEHKCRILPQGDLRKREKRLTYLYPRSGMKKVVQTK